MRYLVLLACASVALACKCNQKLDDEWEVYKKFHNKVYDTRDEDCYRRNIWEDSVKWVAKHNREYDMGVHTYWVGINQFSDMTQQERVSKMNGAVMPENVTYDGIEWFQEPLNVQLPSTVDWRQKGAVTPVKNQRACGSCWAFSATGTMEGQSVLRKHKKVSLSEQQLVDCDKHDGGCNGGNPDSAIKYVAQNGGIDTESAYSYTAKNGHCHFSKSGVGYTTSGVVHVPASESSLQSAVATVGPISVCIDASHRSFGAYKGGVYNEPACSHHTDHCVLAVGYGTMSGKAYWLVKNSWGTNWGVKGYIYMSRNKGNQCAIASYGTYSK
ncbi:cathepsin L1 [Lingula anatina]|uniref:Cathepsin L1 n=1 Tax=Lingula anatina TaxID=7574 RepID=A0A1S3K7R6_LINAN|nr:cathepsin L1 [Lingula anatina]|eukprot:XP_013418301.1 cathepsin L1 [Lingula anatina]